MTVETAESPDPQTPTTVPPRAGRGRIGTLLACVAAGLLIAASMPPWGWWPLGLLGLAGLDQLVAHHRPFGRFRRATLVSVAWLGPSMLWMWDLTPPGYLVATVAYSAFFGGLVALAPGGRGRPIGLVAAVVISSALRSAWPFGGVPLSTLALSLAASPLLPLVRLAGPLTLVAAAAVIGVTLSAGRDRRWLTVGVGAALVIGAAVVSSIAPKGEVVGEIDVALVQGGGEQRTRFTVEGAEEVFRRHLEATRDVETPVDLVVWPENVVNINGELEDHPWYPEVLAMADSLDATLVPGVFSDLADDNVNYSLTVSGDGEILDRYDKVWIVPFGEYVPARWLVEPLADLTGVLDQLPQDARRGEVPASLSSPVGELGVMISWEVFFAHRARDAVRNGGEILLNPTNGSSYWLTQVQTQQIAASRLRAVETGRWLIQAAPTGFSAFIDASGTVLERTDIGEQRIIQGTVERRQGLTWAVRFGDWVALAAALLAMPLAWVRARGFGVGTTRTSVRARRSP